MNILAALFGILRKKGLVEAVREGRSLRSFYLVGLPFLALAGALYGAAMGIGIGVEVAVQDAIKVALVFLLTLFLSSPIFLLSYRLLGRGEKPGQVGAVPLTLLAATAVLMVVTSPVVLMLGLLVGYTAEAVYIHVTILNLGLLMGLYLSGSLVFYSFTEERPKLLVPNVVSMVLLGLIAGVLVAFFSPFLAPSETFSVGTDRLKDALGIGVAPRVEASFLGAQEAGRLTYRYLELDAHGNVERDYTVTRAGDNYHLFIALHAVPGEGILEEKEVWILDGRYSHNFAGPVRESSAEELAAFLTPALPQQALASPTLLPGMRFRARLAGDYFLLGRSADGQEVLARADPSTGRLLAYRWERPEPLRPAVTEVREIAAATQDRADLQDSLNRAIVRGSIDRSDATMQDYVNEEAYFAVRYPRDWQLRATWSTATRRVVLGSCAEVTACPRLEVSVYDLVAGRTAAIYAQELAQGLEKDPAYREVRSGEVPIGGVTVGLVEYLWDTPVEGKIKTTANLEYIFVGKEQRYHLHFSVPEGEVAEYRALFETVAAQFVYLR